MSIRIKIMTAVLGLSLVVAMAPGIASAALTSSQVSAIISLLQSFGADSATIANVQASLTGGTPTPYQTSGGVTIPAGFSFTRTLSVGSTGSDVTYLKVILTEQGCFTASITNTGFGPLTQAGVKCFQAKYGINQVGAVGPITNAKLNSLLAGGVVTPGTTPVSGGISAMLSSDTPASTGIVDQQATAQLTNVTFSGTGTVTSVTLTRYGVSDQNALTNVYLFDGNTRLTDGYSFNVSGNIIMNGLSIAVNGTHEISVRADVANGAHTTSSSIAVAMTGFTANGVTQSANVMGNTMNIVTGSIATTSLNANSVSAANVNAGTSQYTFWSAPLQVNTRTVMMKTANFRMVGSAPSDALSNIRMFVDGIDTGKTASVINIAGSNYASFDFTSAPLSLGTGSHTVDVRGDIQKGTNRDVTVSVQQASDLMITDSQMGINVAVGGTVPNTAGKISISTGSATVNINPAFNAMTNIAGGSTNATIGKFTVHAYGEDVKIMSLQVTPVLGLTGTVQAAATATQAAGGANPVVTSTITAAGLGYVTAPLVTVATATTSVCSSVPTATATISGGLVTGLTFSGGNCSVAGALTIGIAAPSFSTVGGLNNVTLYFNGSQVGSQQTWPVSGGVLTFQLGSQAIAAAGQDSTLEIRADLQTTTNVSYTAGQVSVNLPLETSNAQGQSSLSSLGVPTALQTGTVLAMQSGLLAVSKNPAYASTQTLNPNSQNVRIGSYQIQNQSTSEAIRLTSLKVTSTYSGTFSTNFSALRTSDTTGSGSTPIQPTGADTFSVNDVLNPGASMVVDVFANSGNDTGTTLSTTLTVSSIGAVDNIATTSNAIAGQTGLAFGYGNVAVPTLYQSNTTASQFIASPLPNGATNASQAQFNFVSVGGVSMINELKFTVTGTDATPSVTVTNVCVGSVCGSPLNGVADLTGLNLSVPTGGGLTQNVTVSYSGIGLGGLVPNVSSTISLTYIKSTSGGQSHTCTTSGGGCQNGSGNNLPGTGVSGYTVYLVGSKPALSIAQARQTGLNVSATAAKIGEVTISADAAGGIKVENIIFSVSTSGFSSAPTSIGAPYISDNGNTAIAGSLCRATGTMGVECRLGSTYGTNTAFDGYPIGAGTSKVIDLYGTLTGEATNGSGTPVVSTSIAPATFIWDDISTTGASGVGLSGSNIYGFPLQSYSIGQ